MIIKSLFTIILLSGLLFKTFGQSGDNELISKTKKWDAQIAINNYFPSEDYLLGLNLGIINSNRNLSFFTEFDIRPFKKKVLDRQGANLFYQLSELRYYLGVGAEYSIFPKQGDFGVFLQPSLLYTWGEYSGTEIDVPKGWLLLPKVGAVWQFGRNGFLKAGVAFLDDHTERENQANLFIQISGVIN